MVVYVSVIVVYFATVCVFHHNQLSGCFKQHVKVVRRFSIPVVIYLENSANFFSLFVTELFFFLSQTEFHFRTKLVVSFSKKPYLYCLILVIIQVSGKD